MKAAYYGRGRAPERACRKIAVWPEDDRRLWRLALEPGDLLEPGGERAGYRKISNNKVEKGYGRWLTYLEVSGGTDPDASPADRITPPNVAAYVAALQGLGNGSQTVMSRLQELYEAAHVMGPAMDWQWIRRISSRIRARHVPVRDKASKLVGTDDLIALGQQLMDGAASASTDRLRAMDFREGLLIAFVAVRPIRLKNIGSLQLDRHIVRIGGVRWLIVPPEETKNEVPIEMPWPEFLEAALDEWLVHWRPILCRLTHRWTSPIGNALWVSAHGSPMTAQAIYDRVVSRTRVAFGKAINPHCFRDNAATTSADIDPEHILVTMAVLTHRIFSTTERTYIRAKMMEATRRHQEAVLRLRHGTKRTR